jgi:hypothetical protein
MDTKNSIEKLRTTLRGRLIEPREPEYEEARKVYNGMIDKRPRLVAQCADTTDVIACVRFARDAGMLVAVRGGGHNGGGLGTCDDGLVIDLGSMNGVRVDPTSSTVRAEAGCRQQHLDHAAHAFGLAVPAGVVSTTGIAGLTLGGGHGYLTRKYGLTIDNLLEVDVVLADGQFVTANQSRNEDLFWAVRGGGGNFGVVTSFLYRAHPVDTVYAGVTLWELEHAHDLVAWYSDFMTGADEDMYGFFAFLRVPPAPPFPEHLHQKPMCGIVWCYTGPPDRAEATFKPILQLRPTAFEMLGPMPFPALQSMFDPLLPPGLQWYWRGDFFSDLSDEAIKHLLRKGSEPPTLLSLMHLYPISGAPNRIGRTDTAFSYREVKWSMVIAGIDPDPANAGKISKWTKDYWEEMHPYSAGGAYVNFMMEEGQGRVQATYRDNYGRLAAIKQKYDPTNFFRVNQNIRPRS